MPKYSIIIPVFDRPDEVEELLNSLAKQSYTDFDVIIIEDGSSKDSKKVVSNYSKKLNITYHYKPNSGPGDSRNVGMEMATGEYLIFFDSDCLIPSQYFEIVDQHLQNNPLDTFGGPDSAHESFTLVQKAINQSMTSILTTGGVRGKKSKLDNFQPRSFNMGIKKEVYQKVGGFSNIHPGEDPDLSYRIMKAGYRVGLIEDAYVYHKRRINFRKFIKQVYKFGVVRPILNKWHPGRFSIVYTFPSLFLLFSLLLILLAITVCPCFLLPIIGLILLLFFESLFVTKNILISAVSVLTSFIQLYGYGLGFLKSWFLVSLCKKEEKKVFPKFFFE